MLHYCKVFIFVFSCVLLGCNSNSPSSASSSAIELVDVEKFSSLINRDCQLIDVRTPGEFVDGYIANAQNMDFRNQTFEKQIMTLDTSKPVLVYCKSGGRSAKSAALFAGKGFEKVYDLEGGFTAWSKAGKPVSK